MACLKKRTIELLLVGGSILLWLTEKYSVHLDYVLLFFYKI
jgi:hypothetical protein